MGHLRNGSRTITILPSRDPMGVHEEGVEWRNAPNCPDRGTSRSYTRVHTMKPADDAPSYSITISIRSEASDDGLENNRQYPSPKLSYLLTVVATWSRTGRPLSRWTYLLFSQ